MIQELRPNNLFYDSLMNIGVFSLLLEPSSQVEVSDGIEDFQIGENSYGS